MIASLYRHAVPFFRYVRDPSSCPGSDQCTVFGSNDYFVGLGVILDTYNNYNGVHNVSS